MGEGVRKKEGVLFSVLFMLTTHIMHVHLVIALHIQYVHSISTCINSNVSMYIG